MSSMEATRIRWMLITAIAPIAWGSTYFITRHLLPGDTPLWGAVLRCLPAGLIVLLFARRVPTASWWWRSLVLGALTVGGLNVLVYVAAQRLPTTIASTLMSTSAGALLILGWVILHQRPHLAAIFGAAIGIAGVVVMMAPGGADVDSVGVAAAVGAMLSSSLGFVLTAKWGRDVPPIDLTAWQLIAGGILVLPAATIIEGAPPAIDLTAGLGFIYIILVATVLAYVAWFTGLKSLPSSAVGVIGLLNPATGVLLGVLLADEPFGPAQATGVTLVAAGIVAGVTRRAPRRRA